MPDEIVFVVSNSNLEEGGRDRRPLEVCLNVDNEKAAFLGDEPFRCRTDDGAEFVAKISGTHFKNFRSTPVAGEFGAWLKQRCRAMRGDEIHARWSEPGLLAMHYVRKYALPEKDGETVQARRLERETEDAVYAALLGRGIDAKRQVWVASGVIDLLTPEAIYEVKTFLTRDSILQGLGQLFVYRTELDGGAARRLILLGRETRETAVLVPTLARLGVEVEVWAA